MTAIYDINGNSINVDDYTTGVIVTCQLDMMINLFDKSHALIFLTNDKGKIIYANQKFLEVYGYNEEEILYCAPSIFAVPGSSEIIYDEVSLSNHSENWKGKLLSKKSDGNVIVIELNIERLLNEEGNVYATMWVTRDITLSQKKILQLKEQ